ncbi:MAG: prolipoprotein diacylglyceryl transferase [Nannocystis sp.]|nr:prolipoprotein diacylglyceryl transferase [Nannocystis sp.]
MRPILFVLPGLGWALQAYGVLMGAALLLAWWTALDRARRDGLPTETLGSIFVASAFIGIIGARALWLVGHPQALVSVASLIQLPAGGLSAVGGAFAALAVTIAACRWRQIPTFAWLDCLAPALALGWTLERLGAFLAGTEFGRYVAPGEWGYALSVTFPAGSPAHQVHRRLLEGLPTVSEVASAPVHPVQLYAAGMGLLIFGLALRLRRRRSYVGQVFLGVLAALVIARLVIEDPLRFDASAPLWGPLRRGHVAALGLLGVLAAVAKIARGRAVGEAKAR